MTQATTEPVPDPAEAREMTRGKFMRALGIGGGALLGAGMLAKLTSGAAPSPPTVTQLTDASTQFPAATIGTLDVVTARLATRPIFDVTHPGYGGAPGAGTNNTTAINAVISAANTAGGGRVLLGPGRWEYHGALEIPAGVHLDLGRGALVLYLDGDHEGVQLRDNTEISNGSVEVIGSNLMASGGNYHAPIVVGQANNNVGYGNVRIADLSSVSSNRNDGEANGILITGDSHNVRIENVKFPPSSTLCRPIMVHWSGDGANPPALTKHPHNITIQNVDCGALTATPQNLAVVYLSGAYDVRVENVHADETSVSFLKSTAGDYGGEYAGSEIKPLIGQGIVFRNCVARLCQSYGVILDGHADDLAPAEYYSAPVVIENVKIVGANDLEVQSGFRVTNGAGFVIRNCEATGFKYGADVQENARLVRIEGGRYHGNRNHGIFIDHATSPPEDVKVIGAESYNNGSSVSDAAGVYVGVATNTLVRDCTLGGKTTEANQYYGVRVTATGTGAVVTTNHVRRHKTGGKAYSISASTSAGYAAIKLFQGNGTGNGVTNPYEGASPVPMDVKPSALGHETRTLRGSTPPTVGAWKRGDVLLREDVDPDGVLAYTCVVSGTPGTWRNLATAYDANGRLSNEYTPTAPKCDDIIERTANAGVGIPRLKLGSGATGSRPATPSAGFEWFDTTLGKPIWYNGAAWVDATGAAV